LILWSVPAILWGQGTINVLVAGRLILDIENAAWPEFDRFLAMYTAGYLWQSQILKFTLSKFTKGPSNTTDFFNLVVIIKRLYFGFIPR
jgi:hypothetical protein